MTHIFDSEPKQTTPQRRRFQISLKAVMGLVTFLCLLLGYFVANDRSFDEMITRSWAIQDRISQNYHQEPKNTRSASRAPQARQQLARPATPFPLSARYHTGFLGHTTRSAMVWERTLDVSQLVTARPPSDVAEGLINHYEAGLAELGLQRVSAGTQSGKTDHRATAYSIWQSFDHGISILIDVDVDPAPQNASDTPMTDIRIIFTHNEHKWIW